jgi:hypothetical protein
LGKKDTGRRSQTALLARLLVWKNNECMGQLWDQNIAREEELFITNEQVNKALIQAQDATDDNGERIIQFSNDDGNNCCVCFDLFGSTSDDVPNKGKHVYKVIQGQCGHAICNFCESQRRIYRAGAGHDSSHVVDAEGKSADPSDAHGAFGREFLFSESDLAGWYNIAGPCNRNDDGAYWRGSACSVCRIVDTGPAGYFACGAAATINPNAAVRLVPGHLCINARQYLHNQV